MRILLIAVILIGLANGTARADSVYYEWTDENGGHHFTDDPKEVPKGPHIIHHEKKSIDQPRPVAEKTDDSIKTYCSRIAGESYSLMETCIEGEERARERLADRRVEKKIMDYCGRIVNESFSLLETCINGEERSKKAIH